MDAAERMARSAAELEFERLPSSAVEATRRNLLDTLGCAIAGVDAPGCREVAALALGQQTGAHATVWGSGKSASAADAALANGTMAHALDFDDTHDAALLHAGVSVVPAALAVAEQEGGIDGREFITALTAGLDLVCRMGVATQVTPVGSGWMFTSLFGLFGATVAAARLMRLDASRMAHAIGIAYSQAAGNTQCMTDGALTKRMQPGFAARAGVMSAALARAGITGTTNTFEGKAGLFPVYLRNAYDPQRLLRDLGRRFEGEDLSYKPYPACRHTHAAIDATLQLVEQHAIAPKDVERITVGVNEEAYKNVCMPLEVKARPRVVVDAQFSIPYCIATALVRREVFIGDFTPAALGRPEVLRLAALVEPYLDTSLPAERGREATPAVVGITTKDGSVHSCRVASARGGLDAPLESNALAVKFLRCADHARAGCGWPDATGAERLLYLIEGLESLQDVRVLGRALA